MLTDIFAVGNSDFRTDLPSNDMHWPGRSFSAEGFRPYNRQDIKRVPVEACFLNASGHGR